MFSPGCSGLFRLRKGTPCRRQAVSALRALFINVDLFSTVVSKVSTSLNNPSNIPWTTRVTVPLPGAPGPK